MDCNRFYRAEYMGRHSSPFSPLLLSLVLALAGTLVFIETASARTILDMLFGPREIYRENTDRLIDDGNGRRVRPPARNRPIKARPPAFRCPPKHSRPAEHHSEAKPPSRQKLPDAKTVLIVGDFMAGSLAEGLDAAFIDSPGVRVVDKSDGSSGFVRNDHRDWPATIGGMIEAEKPAVSSS